VYDFGTYVVVGPPKVVVVFTESSGADDVDDPLSVKSPLRIARAANAHVLHNRYM
jgi:hypothetical protein